jgi:hypothetical protein
MKDRQNNGQKIPVSFVHCFVCPSLTYAFLLPLGIFCPLLCPSFIDLHLLFTPWYLLSIVLSVLHFLLIIYNIFDLFFNSFKPVLTFAWTWLFYLFDNCLESRYFRQLKLFTQFLIDAFTIFTLERNGIQFIWMMNIYEKR